jgi:membrane protein
VSHFGKYNVTYGSLGGVIVLVTWLYLSSFILLFGAEFNSEVEHQTARDTTTDAGEKPLGTRGAWSADHVADGPDDAGKEAAQGQQPGQQQRVSDDAEPVFAGPIAPPRPQGWSAARENAQDQHPYLASRATNRAASCAGKAAKRLALRCW